MNKSKDYLPNGDDIFNGYQLNFMTVLLANYGSWLINGSDVNALQVKQSAWASAYAAGGIGNKGTRTPAQVRAKTLARKDYEKAMREFVKRFISSNPLVSDPQKVALGVTVPKTHRTPAPVPNTTPNVDATQGNGNQVKVFFKQQPDEKGVSRRGKPKGIALMEILYKVGDTPPATVNDCNLSAMASRSPLKLNFDASNCGKKVYGFCRWRNTRNQPGEFTQLPLQVVIP
ncbi:MAG: hypothetical protein HY063_14255 [Bacteroidetes bacterium]|nr:hypothetical protein [Bacteroidota bacterium]